MSKRSRRPGRAARDVHKAILDGAALLRAQPSPAVRQGSELPELAALLQAARAAIGAAVPRSFTFEGREYWVSARLVVTLDVFGSSSDHEPLVRGMAFDFNDYGFRPGH
jgi:hypothetical protein